MFRLDKLEISGFKSFYDPAQLLFPSPVTAVVGPNGCGKSNICDAIIWVLGEHRASHIRGETMEDVIFQGSARRRALGMGEVTMTLASDNGHPAAEDGKLVISRRVFRSGESEFRLNGKRVRLKDISDVLMDTGLGIRNYAVMEQGKIDLIISNKPQDRRKLIEEAAGITKYKTKRRAAELKLEETQANLLRIDDTLSEINRNLNSLKRQASKARKHKELIEALSTAKRSLYAGRVLIARTEQEASTAAVDQAVNAEGEAAARLGSDEASLAETRTILSGKAAEASSIREEVARLGSEADRLRSFLEQSETNLADLVLRLEASRTQVGELQSEGEEQELLLQEKTTALEQAASERNRLREVAEDLERTRQERADEVRTNERSLAESRESLMRVIARSSEARNQVHQIEIAAEKCEFYLGKLNETARRATDSRDSALERVSISQQALQEAEQDLTLTRQRAAEAIALRDSLTAERDAMRTSLASSRDAISQTTWKIDSLRSLLITLESQEEDIRRAILDLVPNGVSAAESVRAAEGFETALDVLLRDISKAVVLEDSTKAIEVIGRLRERGAGRGAFIATDYRTTGEGTRRGNAADAIIGEGAVADAVRAAVPEAYFAETLEKAVEQSRQRPHATFITRDGDVVRGPLLVGGRKESAQPGVFSIKRELRDLEDALGAEELRASGIAVDLQRVEESLRAADDARIVAEERERSAEAESRERKIQAARVEEELERFEKDLTVASEERALYEEEKSQLLTRRAEALEELGTLQQTETSTHEAIRSSEDLLQRVRVEFETITEVVSGARVELETAIGQVNAAQREHENLSRVVTSIRSRIAQLQLEITSLLTRQTETESAVESSRQKLEETLDSLRSFSERRIAVEAEVADLEQQVQSLDARALASRETWNSMRDELFQAERRQDRAQSAFDLLREQVLLDLHAGLEALAEVEPPADDETRTALENEVARLTDQIDKIGPVNVLAIEEHRELEEREIFLRTQRDDLVQAIDSLRSTIRKINMTSRELFREAFTAVNQSFGEIFAALFGGGQAAMQLLNEEDVLESGIELIAQPPGKKTQSIALLSGGERALTALALLFAIFRYKPSPFCILDEVDAPLDEINNERFIRLVRDMSRETQFIMITHSRRTMEAADALYGVTMEEAGCSRLVSVSFADLEA
ncbi:MAG TPA: chromosome segregation protein SMC [Thermoanaerobaculia bacterium]|nr:chromosome segregation protein SMC [Thermoanaerobaculia bacterium]